MRYIDMVIYLLIWSLKLYKFMGKFITLDDSPNHRPRLEVDTPLNNYDTLTPDLHKIQWVVAPPKRRTFDVMKPLSNRVSLPGHFD